MEIHFDHCKKQNVVDQTHQVTSNDNRNVGVSANRFLLFYFIKCFRLTCNIKCFCNSAFEFGIPTDSTDSIYKSARVEHYDVASYRRHYTTNCSSYAACLADVGLQTAPTER